jgi:hypothetical protein
LTNGTTYWFVVTAEDSAAPSNENDPQSMTQFTATPSASADALYVDSVSNIGCSSTYTDHNSWATAADEISCITGNRNLLKGHIIIVRANGPGNPYAGFSVPDGTTITAEFPGTAYPWVDSKITFNDTYTQGAVLEYMELVVSQGASVYLSDPSMGNNTKMRHMIIHEGTKPGIKHEDGAPTLEYNEIYNKPRTAISIQGCPGSPSEAMILRGNNFHNNGEAGGNTYNGEIYFRGACTRYILFQNNHIHHTNSRGGINITSGTHYLYFTGNEFDNNPFAGIHVTDENLGEVIISGEPNFTFPSSGPSYSDGSPNLIHNNGRGGITTEHNVVMDIIKNDIYDNDWGGISTDHIDVSAGYPNYDGFKGTMGGADLWITKNYIHGNGKALNTIGGGINVRQATAIIENNVIYNNNRAGIRAGDYVTDILNNTVVYNGGWDGINMGGGIVYDSMANIALDSRPVGTPSSPINVKNNVIAYSKKAALRGMGFTNTPGAEERDYNLLYANNMGGFVTTPDCTLPATFRCYFAQYGFRSVPLVAPHDIFADPVFVDMTPGTEDYQLDTGSPGIGAGEGGTDMGAWGGADPMDWSHAH